MNKLIIFDLDGTLYKTEKTSVAAVLAAFKDLGYESVPKERILDAIGETFSGFFKKLIPDLAEPEIEKLIERSRVYERELIPKQGELYEGVPEMLEELKAKGYLLAVCSNGMKEYVESVLENFGLRALFGAVKSKAASKSKSDLIFEIMDELKTQDAVMVGDRVHDFEAAKECKIPSIGVTYGYGKNEVEQADYIAENTRVIIQIVELWSLVYRE